MREENDMILYYTLYTVYLLLAHLVCNTSVGENKKGFDIMVCLSVLRGTINFSSIPYPLMPKPLL